MGNMNVLHKMHFILLTSKYNWYLINTILAEIFVCYNLYFNLSLIDIYTIKLKNP